MFVDDVVADHLLQSLLPDVRSDNGDILATIKAFAAEDFLSNRVGAPGLRKDLSVIRICFLHYSAFLIHLINKLYTPMVKLYWDALLYYI